MLCRAGFTGPQQPHRALLRHLGVPAAELQALPSYSQCLGRDSSPCPRAQLVALSELLDGGGHGQLPVHLHLDPDQQGAKLNQELLSSHVHVHSGHRGYFHWSSAGRGHLRQQCHRQQRRYHFPADQGSCYFPHSSTCPEQSALCVFSAGEYLPDHSAEPVIHCPAGGDPFIAAR